MAEPNKDTEKNDKQIEIDRKGQSQQQSIT